MTRCRFFLIWNTSRIRSLFPLKDKNLHPQCLIYEGTCSCGAKYIGETDRCFHLRTGEHDDVKKSSEPAKHLKANHGHHFSWKILALAPSIEFKRKMLEALFICKFKPGLNEQVRSKKLRLFPNGLTWFLSWTQFSLFTLCRTHALHICFSFPCKLAFFLSIFTPFRVHEPITVSPYHSPYPLPPTHTYTYTQTTTLPSPWRPHCMRFPMASLTKKHACHF